MHGFEAHGVSFYTMEDLKQDFATLDELPGAMIVVADASPPLCGHVPSIVQV